MHVQAVNVHAGARACAQWRFLKAVCVWIRSVIGRLVCVSVCCCCCLGLGSLTAKRYHIDIQLASFVETSHLISVRREEPLCQRENWDKQKVKLRPYKEDQLCFWFNLSIHLNCTLFGYITSRPYWLPRCWEHSNRIPIMSFWTTLNMTLKMVDNRITIHRGTTQSPPNRECTNLSMLKTTLQTLLQTNQSCHHWALFIQNFSYTS